MHIIVLKQSIKLSVGRRSVDHMCFEPSTHTRRTRADLPLEKLYKGFVLPLLHPTAQLQNSDHSTEIALTERTKQIFKVARSCCQKPGTQNVLSKRTDEVCGCASPGLTRFVPITHRQHA